MTRGQDRLEKVGVVVVEIGGIAGMNDADLNAPNGSFARTEEQDYRLNSPSQSVQQHSIAKTQVQTKLRPHQTCL